MELDGSKTARDPREIHELAYWKHLLGVSEYAVLTPWQKLVTIARRSNASSGDCASRFSDLELLPDVSVT